MTDCQWKSTVGLRCQWIPEFLSLSLFVIECLLCFLRLLDQSTNYYSFYFTQENQKITEQPTAPAEMHFVKHIRSWIPLSPLEWLLGVNVGLVRVIEGDFKLVDVRFESFLHAKQLSLRLHLRLEGSLRNRYWWMTLDTIVHLSIVTQRNEVEMVEFHNAIKGIVSKRTTISVVLSFNKKYNENFSFNKKKYNESPPPEVSRWLSDGSFSCSRIPLPSPGFSSRYQIEPAALPLADGAPERAELKWLWNSEIEIGRLDGKN